MTGNPPAAGDAGRPAD